MLDKVLPLRCFDDSSDDSAEKYLRTLVDGDVRQSWIFLTRRMSVDVQRQATGRSTFDNVDARRVTTHECETVLVLKEASEIFEVPVIWLSKQIGKSA